MNNSKLIKNIMKQIESIESDDCKIIDDDFNIDDKSNDNLFIDFELEDGVNELLSNASIIIQTEINCLNKQIEKLKIKQNKIKELIND